MVKLFAAPLDVVVQLVLLDRPVAQVELVKLDLADAQELLGRWVARAFRELEVSPGHQARQVQKELLVKLENRALWAVLVRLVKMDVMDPTVETV